MILKFILDIILLIMSGVWQAIGWAVPEWDGGLYISNFFTLMGQYFHTGINGVYFLFGPSTISLITVAGIFLATRYLVFPLVVIIRRFFIKGGDN